MKRVSKVIKSAKAKLSTVNCQLSIILFLLLFGGCKKDDKDNTVDTTVPVTGITLSPATQTLTVGGAGGQLTATITPANADQDVKWSVEPPTVVIVADDGSLIALTAGVATVTATAGGKTASAKVTVTPAAVATADTFPDANFRAYVMETFDTDKDGIISATEAADVNRIDCRSKNIASLEGIGVFTALTELRCYSNQLTALDVSRNTALTLLSCGSNQLNALDVSKNTALTSLDCAGNPLNALDVSKNTALTVLNCGDNPLNALDVSKNTALTSLYCGNNRLSTLDVSKNTALTSLGCASNHLSTLDVSKNTALTFLGCRFNTLSTLDVSKNTALTFLDCGDNPLNALDVSKNTALTNLWCDNNTLSTLDVINNTALTYLWCDNNTLSTLDVSNNTALTFLDCQNNQLDEAALNALFNSLPDVASSVSAMIRIGNNSGTSTCDFNIAEDKGWTVQE